MGTAGRLLIILVTPSAVAAAAIWLPHALRAAHQRLGRREAPAVPVSPPVEKTAADLRRLLAEHDALRRSPHVAVRASRLAALEGAITDVALTAARTVGVTAPERSGREPLPRTALHALLRDLVAAGLVLPSVDESGR